MRSTERLTGQHGALLVVDVQAKLVPKIHRRDLMIANAVRLVRGARALGLPVWGTEQYPQGLGSTIDELAELIPERAAKSTFHCLSVPQLFEGLHNNRIQHVTLAGIEAHVCVAQTALELLGLGFRVQVPADAVGSRSAMDWEFALRRLENAGVVISTTEAVLFEWTERSDRPEFKAISDLIKNFHPPDEAGHER